jgi:hypothetical protein
MRKLEIGLGVAAGTTGIILSILSMMQILPYTTEDIFLPHDAANVQTYAIVLLAANAIGVAGAVIVKWHHVLGSVTMFAVTLIVLVFGFPWQSIPAVVYVMSVVLAMVPVKYEKE